MPVKTGEPCKWLGPVLALVEKPATRGIAVAPATRIGYILPEYSKGEKMRKSSPVFLLFSLLFISSIAMGKDYSTLVEAVEQGDLDAVKAFIHNGWNVNEADKKEGSTPLISAVMFGRVDIVQELIRNKADVNLPDQSNKATPLMWASILDPGKVARKKALPLPTVESKVEIARILLEAHASVNEKNYWGGTALLWAADSGLVGIVKLLIESGASVDAADEDGLTPLMAAANYGTEEHLQATKTLLNAGAGLNKRSKSGDSVLMYAVNPLDAATVDFLIQRGADVNAKNNAGLTPLMKASQLSRLDAMKSLIKAGANVNEKTEAGESVLAVAKRAGYEPAIQLLIESGARL
jgi:ankyrin repeat protein